MEEWISQALHLTKPIRTSLLCVVLALGWYCGKWHNHNTRCLSVYVRLCVTGHDDTWNKDLISQRELGASSLRTFLYSWWKTFDRGSMVTETATFRRWLYYGNHCWLQDPHNKDEMSGKCNSDTATDYVSPILLIWTATSSAGRVLR